MEKTLLTWHHKDEIRRGIAQIYSNGLEYALVSDNNVQIGQLVYCKDFFQDVYSGHYGNRKVSIYSYTYDPAIDPPPSLKHIRVVVVNHSDKDFAAKIPQAVNFLHQFEEQLGLSKTTVLQVENTPKHYASGGYVFEGDVQWISSPVMISLYTLLLRVGMVYPGGDKMEHIQNMIDRKVQPYQRNDAEYLKSGLRGLNWILECGPKNLFKEDFAPNFEGDTSFIHNYTGIVGFSSKEAKGKFKVWYDNLNATRRANKAKLVEVEE